MEEIKLLDQAGLAVAWERSKEVFAANEEMKDAVVVNGEVRMPSKGLLYELNDDGESYKVVGIGSCTDINIVVPRTYRDTPITRIDDHAFENAQIDSINLWETVTSIGSGAFIGCAPCRFIYMYSTEPIELEASPFPADNVEGYFVPLHSVDAYKAQWTAYADKIVPIETPEAIYDFVLNTVVTNLSAVDAALAQMDANLMQVDQNLVAVDANLQQQIDNLKGYSQGLEYEVVNIDGVLGFGVKGKGTCTDTDIVIPPTYNGYPVLSVEEYAFGTSANATVRSVVIPATMKHVKSGAFRYCMTLASVTFLGTVPHIAYETIHGIMSSSFPFSESVKTYYVPANEADAYESLLNDAAPTGNTITVKAIETLETLRADIDANLTQINNVQEAIEAEATRATDEENSIRNLVSAEVNRAIEAEANLDSRLEEVETFFKLTEEETLDAALDTLVEIQKYITNEGSAADQMVLDIAANAQAIENMDTAYKIADVVLQNNIDNKADSSVVEIIDARVENLETVSATKDEVAVVSNSLSDYQNTHKDDYTNAQIDNAIKSVDDKVAALDNTYATDAELVEVKTDLESEIANVHTALSSTIATTTTELEEAIANGDTELNDKISALSTAVTNTQNSLKETNTNLNNLDTAYKAADVTLTNSINQVQTNLDNAVVELGQNITDSVNTLDEKITTVETILQAKDTELQEAIDEIDTELNQHLTVEYKALQDDIAQLKSDNLVIRGKLDTLWAQVYAPEDVVSLEVEKITANTYANGATFMGEEFVLLTVYPKTNGIVSITYGDVTKYVTDTTGAAEPAGQPVYFGTFNGVTDALATPASGIVVISGDYSNFTRGIYHMDASTEVQADCITAIHNFGSITTIMDWAFADCNKLTKVVFTDDVTSIGNYAFARCTNLVKVKMSNSNVNSIGNIAFFGCEKIVDIIIPASTTVIGPQTFVNCFALRNVIFSYPAGWYVAANASDTSGTTIDVTVPTINSVNITSTYANYYWKRA